MTKSSCFGGKYRETRLLCCEAMLLAASRSRFESVPFPHPPVIPPSPPEVSIVIPFFNESEGARHLVNELQTAVEALEQSVEILLVDDGSTDSTAEELDRCARGTSNYRVIRMGQNCGQAAALFKGMRQATAPVVALLDGDGQNVPADLAMMLKRLATSGADMVAGVRVNRDDSWLRRRMSRLANAVRSRFLRDGVSDTGCGLKVFKREVIDAFVPIRTLYSFMPALAAAAGFRVVEQPVRHRARVAGVSKYGLGVMLWRPLLDMLGVWWFTRRRFQLPRVQENGRR